MFKAFVHKVGVAALAVVHDKGVQRSAKAVAVLALARGLMAAGASAEVVALVQKALS